MKHTTLCLCFCFCVLLTNITEGNIFAVTSASSNVRCFCHIDVVESGNSQGESSCAVITSDKKKRSNPLIQSVMYY